MCTEINLGEYVKMKYGHTSFIQTWSRPKTVNITQVSVKNLS